MTNEKLPRYATIGMKYLYENEYSFKCMDGYSNTAPSLKECPSLPVDLKEFSKAYLCEASRNLEEVVDYHKKNGLKNFDANFTNAPKNTLWSIVYNKVSEELREMDLFKKYAAAMGAAFLSIDDMFGLSSACEALDLKEQTEVVEKEIERRFDIDQEQRREQGRHYKETRSYFFERIEEFHTLENFEIAIKFLQDYVEEFRKSDLYNFDVQGYLEDQRKQWIEYRENQERIKSEKQN